MIDELKELVNTSHTEITESLIRNQIQTSFSLKMDNGKKNYYFSSDGFWHIYNPFLKIWTKQENKPEEKKKENNDNNTSNDITLNDTNETIKNISGDLSSKDLSENQFSDGIKNPEKEEKNKDILLIKKKRKFGENIEKILTEEQLKMLEKKKKKIDKQRDKKKEKWYAPKLNSNIYITGLPKEITEYDIAEYFCKCGFIRKDPKTNNNKIKLYKDKTGKNKGDALISFLREESVTMAIDLFNESEIKPGYKISIERAKFEQKGDYKRREDYKLDEIQRYKLKTDVDRLLGWNDDEEIEKGLKIIILKNMFSPTDFIEDPELRQDLELDIIEECEEKYGKIDKLKIYEENEEGIIKIKFHSPISAEKCIEALNGRFYNMKNIEAFYWDGKTNYDKISEDPELQNKRIDEFGKWLETQETEKK